MNKVKDQSKENVTIVCKRSIWRFYEWAAVIAPLVLMLSHWYIFYVFSQNTHELLRYSSANEICIAWIYSILYLYVPLVLLSVSYFFKWSNLFRIPFVYFIFINIERWYYGAWFCTNEMIDTHYFLIYCILGMYVVELVGLYLRYRKYVSKYLKLSLLHVVQRMRNPIGCHKDDRYHRIQSILEEGKKC